MANTIGQNIILLWLVWYFIETPQQILKGWKNILSFNFNYFSIPLLFKTLFSYWHQYRWYYPRGFDIGQYLEVFFSNLISRILGAIIRIFMIIFGIIIETLIFIIGIILIIIWLMMPALIVLTIFKGINLIF
ncbi:MAG: hypothetical protein COY04_01480 [Parcubacteria group bacterium CG_4_10_14_0_2_um_filter_7_35_8]|nr:MAG: hypothetical protein COU70_01500 [Parcubacteria group bacterium CG10_big_fil_rev_8_21_14_0_10_35_15]PIZ76241.1 MAG: hypothetical protein COY04_01480 [Parcubacteria group bacterium CG_4_10_14_0_2_um_filter_7_35_8]